MHGLQHNPLPSPWLSRKAIVGSDVRGTCRLLSDWSGVDVTGYPVVSIFDGWFFWEREWAREEENVWLGTRIMYQMLIRGVRVCCRWTEGDTFVKINIIYQRLCDYTTLNHPTILIEWHSNERVLR